MDTLEITQHDGIATVRLNRPDVKNAMSMVMMEELHQAGLQLRDDRALRAIIITGGSEVFCAGIDLKDLMTGAAMVDQLRDKITTQIDPVLGNVFQAPCTVWSTCPVPVIAAINGHCIGAGLQLALGADFRLAAPSARLAILEAKWGLIPDMGITQSLPKYMRADQAKDLMMTGRMLDAPEALELGLVTRITDDPEATAREMAEGFKPFSPDAVAQSKRLVDAAWGATEAALRTEADLQNAIIGKPNQMAKAMASFQKADPTFEDRET